MTRARPDIKPPVNGYRIMERDGRWVLFNDEGIIGEPLATRELAEEEARSLPPEH